MNKTIKFEEKKKRYRERMDDIARHPGRQKGITLLNRLLTLSIYLAYPLLLIYLGWQTFFMGGSSKLLIYSLVVPMDGFIGLTVARFLINRPRPYQVYDKNPAMKKDKKGESFPSRHVFSVFLIAAAYYFTFPIQWLALVLGAIGILLAWVRAYMGVHFLSDVVVGAVLGIGIGALGAWILLL